MGPAYRARRECSVICGALSSRGAPADVLRALDAGEFELIASAALIDELARALAYPKLRRHISESDAAELLRWVAGGATVVIDPETDLPVRSRDPDDDYLIALASTHGAALVSGDKHLLALEEEIPVFSPCAFLDLLAQQLPPPAPPLSPHPKRSPGTARTARPL